MYQHQRRNLQINMKRQRNGSYSVNQLQIEEQMR
jgi:hypothetical protein